jgi:hypothetical protein
MKEDPETYEQKLSALKASLDGMKTVIESVGVSVLRSNPELLARTSAALASARELLLTKAGVISDEEKELIQSFIDIVGPIQMVN